MKKVLIVLALFLASCSNPTEVETSEASNIDAAVNSMPEHQWVIQTERGNYWVTRDTYTRWAIMEFISESNEASGQEETVYGYVKRIN